MELALETVITESANVAIERAVRRERKRLFDFIRRRVRSEQDAEDILQDVFFQLAATYTITEPIEQLTAWLFKVARNKIIDWYRKRRTESLPKNNDDPEMPLNLEDILFDPKETPDRVFARSMVWTELTDALDELPDEQREVFIKHELEGKSFKEISEETGEPINTLLSRKHYAVLFLRERLQELYNEFDQL
ncbi:MAG: RNA polymerase sigma factor [Bacteroidota bacterium]|nr:RNA polymerase sigma factor [Bacteroidota bacterium]